MNCPTLQQSPQNKRMFLSHTGLHFFSWSAAAMVTATFFLSFFLSSDSSKWWITSVKRERERETERWRRERKNGRWRRQRGGKWTVVFFGSEKERASPAFTLSPLSRSPLSLWFFVIILLHRLMTAHDWVLLSLTQQEDGFQWIVFIPNLVWTADTGRSRRWRKQILYS